jgi:hypothetical protein
MVTIRPVPNGFLGWYQAELFHEIAMHAVVMSWVPSEILAHRASAAGAKGSKMAIAYVVGYLQQGYLLILRHLWSHHCKRPYLS